MITYCTSIELDLSEDIPQGVCVPCFKTVRIAYNFILQFRDNHLKLISKQTEPDLENEVCDKDSDSDIKNEFSESRIVQSEDNDDSQLIDDEIQHYLEGEQEDVLDENTKEEIIEYEEGDNQEVVPDQQELEEYDQREIDMENMNIQPVTVKVIRQVPSSPKQPQTVLRRRINIRFACPVCPGMFFASFESGLVPHMSLHSEYFNCNICSDNAELYNGDSFLNHYMGLHRYQCPYCGKSFNKTGTLTAHIKTHYRFRFHCSHDGCPKSFPTQWSLKKHEAVHSNSCEFSCAECNMEFKTYDTFMYHQKKHGGRKFLCMCCGRTFLQSVHLKYHMQQHTGIKHFKCNFCVKSYTSSSQLKKHKRRHHPEQMEATENSSFVVDIL
ncbi:zinc finger protein 680-like isoform X2 [Diorhabda sublineata]|nr:zinc finger protein 680-like isoform X2 [Diorhabda sublineata]